MTVLISKIYANKVDIEVDFVTPYGEATAIWIGEAPKNNNIYNVEIDVDDMLIWGSNVKYSGNGRHFLRKNNNDIIIEGTLDFLGDDGYTIIRLGNSIIPLFSAGIPLVMNVFVEAKIRSISLTPFDLW